MFLNKAFYYYVLFFIVFPFWTSESYKITVKTVWWPGSYVRDCFEKRTVKIPSVYRDCVARQDKTDWDSPSTPGVQPGTNQSNISSTCHVYLPGGTSCVRCCLTFPVKVLQRISLQKCTEFYDKPVARASPKVGLKQRTKKEKRKEKVRKSCKSEDDQSGPVPVSFNTLAAFLWRVLKKPSG